jgi:glutathione peroxidase
LNYGDFSYDGESICSKGADICALYQFLTQKAKNGLQDSDVEWNFQKYLINENGELDQVIKPQHYLLILL